MSERNSKPDLEDSINVTEAHGKVVREAAACAREKRIVDNGIEPVSLWAFVACGVVLLIAGGILGGGGKLVRLRRQVRGHWSRLGDLPVGSPLLARDARQRFKCR